MSKEDLYRKLYPTEKALADILIRGNINSGEAVFLSLSSLRKELKDYLLIATEESYDKLSGK